MGHGLGHWTLLEILGLHYAYGCLAAVQLNLAERTH